MEKELLPHQQRVVDERQELETKICALSTFLEGVVFSTLSQDEQDRLIAQVYIMQAYSSILQSRIKNF